jgi:hypothetical protein
MMNQTNESRRGCVKDSNVDGLDPSSTGTSAAHVDLNMISLVLRQDEITGYCATVPHGLKEGEIP